MHNLLNFEKYPAVELIPFLSGCFLWVIAYGIYARDVFRKCPAEMPFIAAMSNFAWEFLWSFIYVPDMGPLVMWGYRAWFFFDIIIIVGVWRYGAWQIADPRLRKLYKPLIVGWLAFFVTAYYFFIKEGHDTPIGANSAYIAQILISTIYIVLISRSNNVRQFSYPVVWLRSVGTAGTTIFMFMHYRDGAHGFLLTVSGTTLLLDIYCVWLLTRLRKTQKAEPSGRVVKGIPATV